MPDHYADEPTPYRNEEWLREKYWGEELSTAAIAEECGVNQTTISRWLREHGIDSRSPGGKPRDLPYKDEDWLRQKYVEEGLSGPEIAEISDVSLDVIQRWMEKFDIERRDYGGYPKDAPFKDADWLREKYHDEGLSLEAIAEEAGVESEVTILRWMDEHEIERRESSPGNDVNIQDEHRAFLDGLLLGDGHYAPRKGGQSAQYEHSDSYRSFLVWLQDELEELGFEQGASIRELPNGSFAYKTKSYRPLREEYDRWYPNGDRQVPDDIRLTPTTLLLWYIGDGRYTDPPSILRDPMHHRKSPDALLDEFERIDIDVTVTEKRYRISEGDEERFFDYLKKSPYFIPDGYSEKFPDSDSDQ